MIRSSMGSLVSKYSLGWVLCAPLALPQLAQAEAPQVAFAPSPDPPPPPRVPVRESVREKTRPHRGLLIAGSGEMNKEAAEALVAAA